MSGGGRKGEEVMNGVGQTGRSATDVESLVNSFVGVTSAYREEALFFLEGHEWHLDSAIESFFDDGQPPEEEEEENNEEEEGEGKEADSDDEDYVPSEDVGNSSVARRAVAVRVSGSGSRGKEKSGKPSKRSAITTFSDLKRKAESDSDSDTDSDEDQDYYAGGEKSGMLVRDSSRKRNRNNAEAIFEQARKFARPTPSKSKSKSFTGKGRVLSSEQTPSSGAQQMEGVSYDIYFWRNGFTVNNGPLRGFDDPENAVFLEDSFEFSDKLQKVNLNYQESGEKPLIGKDENTISLFTTKDDIIGKVRLIHSIKKSECPEELKPPDGSSEVHVKLIHRQSNYPTQAPQPPHNGAFRGTGRTLGTDPEQVPDMTADVLVPAPARASNTTPGFGVDESLPTTSVQIRLSDGTRLVARFNTSNTIRDLRAFIDASRPSGSGTVRSYQLQTVGFPPKPLDDISKTIEEEGIANSVVIQKV